MKPFAVTWDYRCPFARNAHEHLALALAKGADWDVTFLPFSLSQTHVPEGGTPVWEDPEKAGDLLALAAGLVVRDQYPAQFLDAHIALFSARHDEGLDLRLPEVVSSVLEAVGVPGDKVLAEVGSGNPCGRFDGPTSTPSANWTCSGFPHSLWTTAPFSYA